MKSQLAQAPAEAQLQGGTLVFWHQAHLLQEAPCPCFLRTGRTCVQTGNLTDHHEPRAEPRA